MPNVTTTVRTPFSIASSALVMLGANPVSSFKPTGTAETIACYYTWQPCVDHYLSLYPWRFATAQAMLSRLTTQAFGGQFELVPVPPFVAVYWNPTGMKHIQGLRAADTGQPIQYERFGDVIHTKQAPEKGVMMTYSYEPPIAWWPGYFATLIEAAMMHRLSFALSAKLDLKREVKADIETLFRFARSADSQMQTTRKLRLDGPQSITAARRA